MSVLFGNVLGSNASVVPIFKQQIANGGPVTVTDADAERFFMSISEAAGLILQAATCGSGGEIFVLDMGEPVRILDLAETLITLAGLKPYEDIKIVFTGLKPGEKLTEELHLNGEMFQSAGYDKVLALQNCHGSTASLDDVREFLSSVPTLDGEQVRFWLQSLVPDYQPTSFGARNRADIGGLRAEHGETDRVVTASFD